MRQALALLHRWAGLALILCLLPACLAGSVIVWKTELDRWLNPDLFFTDASRGPLLDEGGLEAALKAQVPRVRIGWIELPVAPGRTAQASVGNWSDPADPARRYNEVYLDPVSGKLLGARSTSKPRLDRREGLIWLRRIHYSLGILPGGLQLMGWTAVAWLLDSLVGTAVSFHGKTPRRWLRAFRVRRRYWDHDLHRAGSLWLWPVVITLAASSVFLNLQREIFLPTLDLLLRLVPAAWREPLSTAVVDSQFPLHTGTALGTAGRVLVSLTGLVVSIGLLAALRAWCRRALARRELPPGQSTPSRAAESGAREISSDISLHRTR